MAVSVEGLSRPRLSPGSAQGRPRSSSAGRPRPRLRPGQVQESHFPALCGHERGFPEPNDKVGRWFAEHAAAITHHAHLQPAHTATTVRLDEGRAQVTDGPFVEGKEVVSGFVEVDVADLDEALAIARSWPGCPIVELRPASA